MRTKDVRCNSCGAPFSITAQSENCPFCGSVFKESGNSDNSSQSYEERDSEGELFVLFQSDISEDDFNIQFEEHVIQVDSSITDFDADVSYREFECVRLRGLITGTFICKTGVERTNYVPKEDEDSWWTEEIIDIEYVPFQAPFQGIFEIDFCTDEALDDVPELQDFVESYTDRWSLSPFTYDEYGEIGEDQSGEMTAELRERMRTAVGWIGDDTFNTSRVYSKIKEAADSIANDAAHDNSKDIKVVAFDFRIDKSMPFIVYLLTKEYTQNGVQKSFLVDPSTETIIDAADAPVGIQNHDTDGSHQLRTKAGQSSRAQNSSAGGLLKKVGFVIVIVVIALILKIILRL